MNARHYLRTHPLILSLAREMQTAGLIPETITGIIGQALTAFVPSEHDREEISRIIRRALKRERQVSNDYQTD